MGALNVITSDITAPFCPGFALPGTGAFLLRSFTLLCSRCFLSLPPHVISLRLVRYLFRTVHLLIHLLSVTSAKSIIRERVSSALAAIAAIVCHRFDATHLPSRILSPNHLGQTIYDREPNFHVMSMDCRMCRSPSRYRVERLDVIESPSTTATDCLPEGRIDIALSSFLFRKIMERCHDVSPLAPATIAGGSLFPRAPPGRSWLRDGSETPPA
jgi:hypothetical protein